MTTLAAAIYSRLTGTAITSLLAGTTAQYPSAVYRLQASEGAPYPYVVYSIQGGGDENKTPRRSKNLVLFVRAYSNSSASNAGSIDAQIDTALHMVPFTGVTGFTGTWLAREQDLETVENPPTGARIFMQGGLYRSRQSQ